MWRCIVFDTRDYREIFRNGFKAWPKGSTPNSDYYNLSKSINSRSQPLDYNRCPSKSSIKVVMNIGNELLPRLPCRTQTQYYRYEIHAPDIISVDNAFWKEYKYKKQEEVCFSKGIATRYFYEGTEEGTLFDATTQVRGSRSSPTNLRRSIKEIIIIKLYTIIVCNIVRYYTIL